ncbi:LCP family protein [Miltoncostaea oceani]|uniref:LCP family protein n=1 Tax=Miltoncostaea oceani TaxID=2843216 RepID=UPI001C3E4065|nr:LCP family protein [Miltoncostaea oceani]
MDRFGSGDKAAVVDATLPFLGTGAPGSAEVDLPAPAGAQQTTNVLLIGSDTRTSSGGNSDTLILARLDDAKGTISLLSIPRDLKVPIPKHQDFKINGAYSIGGPALTIETVRDYFQVRIDHFAVVDFAGFQKLVETLDGVYLSVDQRYFNRNDGSAENNYADIDLEVGYQKLEGADALSFARFRHTDSDYFRQARQQMFLSELKRVLSTTLGPSNPGKLRNVLEATADATTSDISSLTELIDLVNAVRDVAPDRVYRFTIPTTGGLESDGRYYLYADPEEVQEVMRAWHDPSAPREPVPQASREGSGVEGSTREDRAVAADGTGDDGGQAAALLEGLSADAGGLAVCAPARRPVGSSYLEDNHRSYRLNNKPSIALAGSLGSGRSFLWMWSAWDRPPILDQPHETRTIDGRRYRLYRDAGHLRVVAFTQGATTVWLTNTLRGDLSDKTMLTMATSCR